MLDYIFETFNIYHFMVGNSIFILEVFGSAFAVYIFANRAKKNQEVNFLIFFVYIKSGLLHWSLLLVIAGCITVDVFFALRLIHFFSFLEPIG